MIHNGASYGFHQVVLIVLVGGSGYTTPEGIDILVKTELSQNLTHEVLGANICISTYHVLHLIVLDKKNHMSVP